MVRDMRQNPLNIGQATEITPASKAEEKQGTAKFSVDSSGQPSELPPVATPWATTLDSSGVSVKSTGSAPVVVATEQAKTGGTTPSEAVFDQPPQPAPF